jgi:hypothetical protein
MPNDAIPFRLSACFRNRSKGAGRHSRPAEAKGYKVMSSVPFAWQDKRILRKIRESLDDCNTVASALGVYLALTVIASDKGADEFQTTHQWLSSLSGFSPATVKARLKDLKTLGVVQFSTPALRAPCVYRLLPLDNDCPTLANGCRTLAKQEAAPVSYIRRKENKEYVANGLLSDKPLTTGQRIGLEKQLADARKLLELHRDVDDNMKDQAWLDGFRELKAKVAHLEAQLEGRTA